MASRSVANIYRGYVCPESINFGFVHGTQPAIATIKYDEARQAAPPVYIGQTTGLLLDRSMFIGFISKKEVTTSDDTGDTITTLTVVDWRDTLHDDYIFAAFNVAEPDGRHWHMMPSNWPYQVKTWVSEEMQQQDFYSVQNIQYSSKYIPIVAKQKLLSAATILNILGNQFDFRWSAEATALQILKTTYPMNLDWTSGITGARALDDLLGKCNARMTCNVPGRIHITIKGFMPQSLIDAFLAGLTNHCLFGAVEGSVGTEINEEGRHVYIVGGRNKHQYTFLCRQNWNSEFDYRMAYNGFNLSALLMQHGLNPLSKLKELPKKYQDNEVWMDHSDGFGIGAGTTKRTRNEMTIEEYVSKIVFKTYIVDFNTALNGQVKILSDTITSGGNWKKFDKSYLRYKSTGSGNLALYPWTGTETTKYGVDSFNSFAPISDALVTESNTNYIAFVTNQEIVHGKTNQIESQKHFVPVQEGVSLNVEEVLNRSDARTEYRARLMFSGPRFIFTDLDNADDEDTIVPDFILVTLALEGKVFTHQKGSRAGVKSRSQKMTTDNLYKAFVNGREYRTLAWNHIRHLEDQGAVPGLSFAKADFIADKMADKMLLHLALNKAGHLKFEDRAGVTCNGLIETVNVAFNPDNGLSEVVNFTKEFVEFDEYGPVPRVDISPKELGISSVIKTEKDINRDRLKEIASAALRQMHAAMKAPGGERGSLGAGAVVGGATPFNSLPSRANPFGETNQAGMKVVFSGLSGADDEERDKAEVVIFGEDKD